MNVGNLLFIALLLLTVFAVINFVVMAIVNPKYNAFRYLQQRFKIADTTMSYLYGFLGLSAVYVLFAGISHVQQE